jgi:glycosyltransferase involved in cell wall biosynthesis
MGTLSYVCLTPARDEALNLPRLAASLVAQTERPRRWIIIDNGSRDGTAEVSSGLAAEHEWIEVLRVDGDPSPVRGAPIVRALHAGVAAIDDPPDIVVNLDADISFEPDYFARLLARFAGDPSLGISSGTCYELEHGKWRQRHVTGTTVWGASRAWRWACLRQILPLEERLGWDGLDEFKANARGWTTGTQLDLPFRHHRPEGSRDGGMHRARITQGRTAHYMGYRPWYLVIRSLWLARRDPTWLVMLWGYGGAAVRREPRSSDPAVRSYVRSQQSLGNLPSRVREARGRPTRAL